MSTSLSASENWGIVSDPQGPYQHPEFLKFIAEVEREFRIPKLNWGCVGDEAEAAFASTFIKSPDSPHTGKFELNSLKELIKEWGKKYPYMRLCYSNHGARPYKRALEAGLPSEFIRSWAEVLGAPKGWKWAKNWTIKTRKPFVLEHGHKWTGINGARNAAVNNGISTIIGHNHAYAAIQWIRTEVGGQHFGMNVGALIDVEAVCFDYDKDNKFLPVLGIGVVVDGGTRPIWIPYEY